MAEEPKISRSEALAEAYDGYCGAMHLLHNEAASDAHGIWDGMKRDMKKYGLKPHDLLRNKKPDEAERLFSEIEKEIIRQHHLEQDGKKEPVRLPDDVPQACEDTGTVSKGPAEGSKAAAIRRPNLGFSA